MNHESLLRWLLEEMILALKGISYFLPFGANIFQGQPNLYLKIFCEGTMEHFMSYQLYPWVASIRGYGGINNARVVMH
uniref:Putative ovule protein n=1 Tax=Solanum chacoense TaxID=4108 RepID=A0A0V0HHR9_SOLCH